MKDKIYSKKLDYLIASEVEKGSREAENNFYNNFLRFTFSRVYNFLNNPKLKPFNVSKKDVEEIVNDTLDVVIRNLRSGQINDKSIILANINETAYRILIKHIRKETAQKRGQGEVKHIPFDDFLINNDPENINFDLENGIIHNAQDLDEEIKKRIDDSIDTIRDKDTWAYLRLKFEGYRNREIREILELADRKFDNLRKHITKELDYIKQYINKPENENLFCGTEQKLENLQYLFSKLGANFVYLTHEINFSLGIIYSILLRRLPKTRNLDILKFKSEVSLFLIELLVNKGILRGQAGAIEKIPNVLGLCDAVGDLEGKIRAKNAESIAWRVLKEYDKSLEALSIAENYAENLTDSKIKDMFKYRLLGYKGRLFGFMGFPETGEKYLKSSYHFLQEKGEFKRVLVRSVDLADNFIILKEFDRAFKYLDLISNLIPDGYINLWVRYHKTKANLFFSTNDFDNGYLFFKKAWKDTDRVHLYNQYGALLDLLNKYQIHPNEVLSQEEQNRGIHMHNIFRSYY